ncbi:MAG: 7-cyano-7-deazaguanine synthase QueC [Robiginitomaculum sp.]|nr:MAG: 7-cyano-7-deazaguanine synthase QueC [Robiginitomaculum sp.]
MTDINKNDINKNSKVLILFSGGQDSATCLAWALEKYDHVETIGFDYGQRHTIEMQCRKNVLRDVRAQFPEWAARLGEDHVLDLSVLGKISKTSLTRDMDIVMDQKGLPNTFVPGRNLIFLNFAAALGFRRGIHTIIAGMCEADFSGYPDCRKETLDATMKSISLGMDTRFTLETPLMYLSKAGAWDLAEQLGGTKLVDLIVTTSHTCYLGERGELYAWGYGCETCPACELRAKGWYEYVATSEKHKSI